ncbi:hypothetical protein V757_09715 [Pelistega indica]|uniref:Cell division protein ZapD n=2 Tax=Alcaligenaceae TaxID=506 RepID=V8FZ06_9BURK|nr:hypothetical protein V757_09715 [Pelistega indica]
MIRLEYLFQQLIAYSQSPTPASQHVTFSMLFEIMDVCDRGDSRNWVLQEIDKQKASLESFRHTPGVDIESLDKTLLQLTTVAKNLQTSTKLGFYVRENEWLLSLKNRFLTPGGTSPMDFPSYTAWLNGNESERVRVIQQLIAPFMPMYEAITQSLRVLREAALPSMESSKDNGVFEKSIGGKVYQMARVWLPKGQRIYPEISGNKHVIMIRFFRISENFRQQLITEPQGFRMALCQI